MTNPHQHVAPTCQPPRPSRRWRNAVWVCPDCRRGYTLVQGVEDPPPGEYAQDYLYLHVHERKWFWNPWPPEGQL